MPLHPDFQKIRQSMRKRYGKDKGDEVFWGWLNKKKLDETKPLSKQKSKTEAQDLIDLFPEDYTDDDSLDAANPSYSPQQKDIPPTQQVGDPLEDKPAGLGEADTDKPLTIGKNEPDPVPAVQDVPLHDQMNRMESSFKAAQFMSIPAYRTAYVAEPKFQSEDAPIIIKSIVLEEGHNINNWRVVSSEFERVAEQYKAGRQLRINHSKDMQDVIGKSFDGRVIKGKDIPVYLGKEIEGIEAEGLYVAAEFEAAPQNPQVRTNILNGYVVTGSIGLDAEAFCEDCNSPLKMGENGEMQRTCRHFDAKVKLRNVEVKEYSYVSEPAFEHSVAFPSFSAAVQSCFGCKKDSSLNTQKATDKVEMSATAPQVSVTAKKAESEGKKAEGEGDSEADAALKLYRKGYADAIKDFKSLRVRADDSEPDEDDVKKTDASAAKAESEGDSDADAKASAKADAEGDSEADAGKVDPGKPFSPIRGDAKKAKTDQVGRIAPTRTMKSPPDLLARVLRPTDYALQDPALRELFRASAETAPSTVKGILTQNLKGRFE